MKRRRSLALTLSNPAVNSPAMEGIEKSPFQKNKIPNALDYLAMDGEQKVVA